MLARCVGACGWRGPRPLAPARALATVAIGKMLSRAPSYEPGQTFVHLQFGYRGIVLHPWSALVYDRPVSSTTAPNSSMARRDTYFIVARDVRDESADMRGFDMMPSYVPYRSILPYKPETAVESPLADGLFHVTPELAYTPNDRLLRWSRVLQRTLPFCSVYRNTGGSVSITVVPQFDFGRHTDFSVQAGKASKMRFRWVYNVTIENTSTTDVVQLLTRKWTIVEDYGNVYNIEGLGVVGKRPILNPGEHFVYESSPGPVLQTPAGRMYGTFTFIRNNKTLFDVDVPTFWPPPDVSSHGPGGGTGGSGGGGGPGLGATW